MSPESLIQVLESQLTPERLARFNDVLKKRTYALSVVLEDVFQGHNAAAVLRSCECFGVQRVHCIENRNHFVPNEEISMGAHKWLHVNRWASTESCLEKLKADGYTLVAMTLRAPSMPLEEIPLERPIALVYGTEEQGLSEKAHALCDLQAHLPMYGFTQSFNISVSVALSLQTLIPRLHNMPHWSLSPQQSTELKVEWLKRSIPHWEEIAKRLNAPKV